MKSLYFIVFTVLFGVTICLPSVASAQDEKKKPVPKVTVMKVQASQAIEEIDATGEIEPAQIAQLASPAEGPIIKCMVREGDSVQAGQVLMEIGRSKATAALLEAAEQDLHKASENARRVKGLVAKSALPEEQLDTVNANLLQSKARVIQLQEQIDDYSVKSPWAAVVSDVYTTEGDFVAPRTALIKLYDPQSLMVKFSVSELDAPLMKIGLPVSIKLDAYPDVIFIGEINRLYPELDRKTRRLTLEAEIKDKRNLTLIPAMFARIKVEIKGSDKVIAVPSQAVAVNAKNQTIVRVVKAGDEVEVRPVKTGRRQGEAVIIIEGINDGETIIVDGGDKIKTGDKVIVINNDKASKSGKVKP